MSSRYPRVERDTGQLTWEVFLEEVETVVAGVGWWVVGERERKCRGKRESLCVRRRERETERC